MSKILIELSKGFKEGSCNTPFFKDIPFMSDHELKVIYDFMQSVSHQQPLRGKNKPSWLDDNLNDIPNTDSYKEYGFWHYHCGPYEESPKLSCMSDLKINLNGETSGPVIHYQKISENHIMIIGYSPRHEPFPKEVDIPNPLITRIE